MAQRYPTSPDRDRILVVGDSARTLDLLRLATIRSDDVALFGHPSGPLLRFAERFAIEILTGPPTATDLAASSAVLVAIGDPAAENAIVRAARRAHVPVHVADRELVSDFKLLDLLEHRPVTSLAA